jgi:hypothetical protein
MEQSDPLSTDSTRDTLGIGPALLIVWLALVYIFLSVFTSNQTWVIYPLVYDQTVSYLVPIIILFSPIVFVIIDCARRKTHLPILPFAVAGLLLSVGLCPSMIFPGLRDDSRQIAEGELRDRVYRLILHDTISDGNFYTLYECDANGLICDKLGHSFQQTLYAGDWHVSSMPTLQIDENAGSVSVVDDNGIAYTYTPE